MTISITRVYTRTGDRGTTALVGGKRVPKDSPRIATYGSIDELNAVLGLARVFNEERLAEGRSTAGSTRCSGASRTGSSISAASWPHRTIRSTRACVGSATRRSRSSSRSDRLWNARSSRSLVSNRSGKGCSPT